MNLRFFLPPIFVPEKRLLIRVMSFIVFFLFQHVQAATFTVTKTADTNDGVCDADCSLREAIIAANALPGADTIIVAANTYILSIAGIGEDEAETGDLDITESLTLSGSGAADTIIDGAGLDGVFHIIGVVRFPCTSANTPFKCGGLVQMSGLTVRNGSGGFRTPRSYKGGGIFIDASSLSLTDSIVSGNTSTNGGGIFNDGGSVTITNSTISGNTATAPGGGIWNSGTLTVTSSTIDDNQAQVGGGISNFRGSVIVTKSTISRNRATSIFVDAGGGISNNRGSVTITNSTISGNTSEDDGGGIYNFEGSLTITNSTLSENAAGRFGGGIRGAATLKDTIVANSTAGDDCDAGVIISEGHNLDSDNTCNLTAAGDLSGIDPFLGPLQGNGAPTETHALLPGSPAIDQIPPENCTVTTDQQGVARPQGAACDIGAFEFRVATIWVANFLNGNSALFNSRIYFWNPSDVSTPVTVRVFTLPLTGASTLLGTVDLGNLAPSSARIIKLAEDILSPLDIPMPYTDNGGNLTLEFTMSEENVRGVAQVFSSSLAFGTYPLQEIQPTSQLNPTVLVGNNLNGNNAAFHSRIYLWNPSETAGEVTVRIFTLERSSISTLLGTIPLGSLRAKSARNIKLAEDILAPLGIALPYTDDGGDLIVELTVEAPGVRGVAQVFSSSLAFGTYPLQGVPGEGITIFNENSSFVAITDSNTVVGFDDVPVGTDVPFTSNDVLISKHPTFLSTANVKNQAGNPHSFYFQNTGSPPNWLDTEGAFLATFPEEVSAVGFDFACFACDPTPDNSSMDWTLYSDADTVLAFGSTIYHLTESSPQFLGIASDIPFRSLGITRSSRFHPGRLNWFADDLRIAPRNTRLVANFMNGNSAEFDSTVYLWNPSGIAGNVTVSLFTLPLTGPSTLLGTVDLGILEASSARIIKLAEDILTPLGISLPYVNDGGNLTLRFVIEAPYIRGTAQVVSSRLAFGNYPLQEIPLTSSGSPTILAANFLNGNNEEFKSRVYLFNPSDSSAAIRARVFTLPPSGPSTLLGTIDLGLIRAESARNIRVAEDVLVLLGIQLPYKDDGGNLTIEFTIEAENVRGVTQVFSDSLAFGTNQLQVVP